MIAEPIIAPEALRDLDEAYSWYEDRRHGLGEDFLTCVDTVVQTICRNPGLYAKIYKDYRRALTRRFPYAVFYEHMDGKIIIYSVFHTSQSPDKWKNRLA
ncbi:Predicted plasmid stabilisation protein ParE [Candidatus Desulfarcum epimagneticum]|uniref:Predicted plasmid stabilisation protein ParE n=1 Tax=uncultured Desulfobacteraceae bacterium TaxID=218296 RepID=A0A484HJ91_9BACT|nr:Predicted plasmid stabilisation protein ParE [uncultured Desulfobacteraceae bacterium]